MFLTLDEGVEIDRFEWAASFLKASANATINLAYSGDHYQWEQERMLKGAADSLIAADKLQGRANMLKNFGRDYVPAEFHAPDDAA